MSSRRRLFALLLGFLAVSPATLEARAWPRDGTLESAGALTKFYEALDRTSRGGGVTRVVQLGDSHTAADLFTAALRADLCGAFGNAGPGLLYAKEPWRWYRRHGVEMDSSTGWRVVGLSSGDGLYGVGGVAAESNKAGEFVRISADAERFEVSLLARPGAGTVAIAIDGVERARRNLAAPRIETAVVTVEARARGFHTVTVSVIAAGIVRILGVSAERRGSGVVVDALGLNGAQAYRPLSWDARTFDPLLAERTPSLVVVAYGTNEAVDPLFDERVYAECFSELLERLQRSAPSASILVLGPPDGLRRVGAHWMPLPWIDRVIAVQRRAASACRRRILGPAGGNGRGRSDEGLGGRGASARAERSHPLHPIRLRVPRVRSLRRNDARVRRVAAGTAERATELTMPILTVQGLYLFTAFFFVYWAIGDRPVARMWLVALVGASFAACGGMPVVAALAVVSSTDYVVARRLPTAGPRWRLALLATSIAVDAGCIAAFKTGAGGFLASGLAQLTVSFFVFQSLGAVVDVWRGAPPETRLVDYFAFVSFVPTIVAGPIQRSRDLLARLRRPLSLGREETARAVLFIAIGLTKKIAIADYLGSNVVDRVFDFPARYSSFEVLTAVYAYALQIYCDFSGYTDIAIGAALLLGVALDPNFDAPYRSTSLPEFWRRWHISLSSWLRDYVFRPVSGARPGRARLHLALVLTMLVGGVWHGVGWTFVVWGALHGGGLVVTRMWQRGRATPFASTLRRYVPERAAAVAAWLGTFHFICLTWIVFRADSLASAGAILRSIAHTTFDSSNIPLPAAVVLAIGYCAHFFARDANARAVARFAKLPTFAQAGALFAIGVGLYYVASADVAPFIYARF